MMYCADRNFPSLTAESPLTRPLRRNLVFFGNLLDLIAVEHRYLRHRRKHRVEVVGDRGAFHVDALKDVYIEYRHANGTEFFGCLILGFCRLVVLFVGRVCQSGGRHQPEACQRE